MPEPTRTRDARRDTDDALRYTCARRLLVSPIPQPINVSPAMIRPVVRTPVRASAVGVFDVGMVVVEPPSGCWPLGDVVVVPLAIDVEVGFVVPVMCTVLGVEVVDEEVLDDDVLDDDVLDDEVLEDELGVVLEDELDELLDDDELDVGGVGSTQWLLKTAMPTESQFLPG